MKEKKRRERNNIFIQCKVTLTTNQKNIDRVLINAMLKTIVPLGYSYRHNEKTKEGVIQIDKNVEIGVKKYDLFYEAVTALISHERIASIEAEVIRLSPVVYVTGTLDPYSYVDANIHLKSFDECDVGHEWTELRSTEDKWGDLTVESVCVNCGKRNVETYDNRRY